MTKKADKEYIEYKDTVMKEAHPKEYNMLSQSYLENSKDRPYFESKTHDHYYSVNEFENEITLAGELLDTKIELRDEIAELRLRRDSRYTCYRRRKK